ncbi:MAG: hypothetical protein ACKO2G_03440 [Verrucomicrobiales bacterium]
MRVWLWGFCADLIELTPADAAKGVVLPGTGAGNKLWFVLVPLLVLLVGIVIWMKRKPKPVVESVGEIFPPSEATPFATVAFLRRIKQALAPKLDATRAAELEAEIASIETKYFTRDANEAPDLNPVIHKWLAALKA